MPGLGLSNGIHKTINRFSEVKTLSYMLRAPLKARATYYENETCTKATLTELENIT